MKILHTSDLHLTEGAKKRLLSFDEDFDLWLDTGDFFPTYGRRPNTHYRIDADAEKWFQNKWCNYKDIDKKLKKWLNGRPVIYVSGNHDFIDLGTVLKLAGHENVHMITPEGLDMFGHRWAGFREVPPISGQWAGECYDFSDIIEKTLQFEPDILVTHAPAHGILDEIANYGISELTNQLMYKPSYIAHHFFGHCHVDGGKMLELRGIKFVNGAQHMKVWEI